MIRDVQSSIKRKEQQMNIDKDSSFLSGSFHFYILRHHNNIRPKFYGGTSYKGRGYLSGMTQKLIIANCNFRSLKTNVKLE